MIEILLVRNRSCQSRLVEALPEFDVQFEFVIAYVRYRPQRKSSPHAFNQQPSSGAARLIATGEIFMATKTDFSAPQWDLLRKAPLTASLIVSAASPSGPVGLVQESVAASKMILNEASTAKTPLVKSVSEDLRSNFSFPELPHTVDPAQLRASAIDTLKQSSALLTGKVSAEEAQEYRQWLANIAQATAEAAKEGGFLGFGGTQVSAEEQAALAEIHEALGLPKAA